MKRGGGPTPFGSGPSGDKPKREAILDLSKYANQRIRVKFTGGREGICDPVPLCVVIRSHFHLL